MTASYPPPPPPPSPPPKPNSLRGLARWWVVLAGIVVVAVITGVAVIGINLNQRPHFGTSSPTDTSPSSATESDQAAALLDAYHAGKIDRPTWLLDRALSMFGVSSLPQEYRQGAANDDDIALVDEMQSGSSVPAAVRDTITALIDRPTDTHSVYYGSGPVASAAISTGTATLAADEVAYGDSCKLDPSAWIAAYTTKFPGVTLPGEAPHGAFKVWTRCAGDWQGRLSAAVTLIDSLWGPETALMGQPVADKDPSTSDVRAFGGDSAIDFYLLPRDFPTNRLGAGGVTISGITRALTHATDPFIGRKSSGFVLLDQGRLGDPTFREDIAHELFHLLQYAHNHLALRDRVSGDLVPSWYTEASATWAGYHFARDVITYSRMKSFQLSGSFIPLTASGPRGSILSLHSYAAFVWFYFMEQEGGAEAIARAWAGLENADSAAQGTAYLDQVFSFSKHFEDFALRNLDQAKYKAAVGTLYQGLDPRFPEIAPGRVGSIDVANGGSAAAPAAGVTATVDHLTANYYDVTPTADVKNVTFTFNAQPSLGAYADLVTHSAKGWARITLVNGDTTVCIDGVDEMTLVLSYGDYQGSTSATISGKGRDSCVSPLTVTSVAPNKLIDRTTTTVVIHGTGFTSLTQPQVTLTTPGGSFADIDNENVRVVSDTEIDVSGTFSAVNGYADFDVVVFETTSPTQARCSGCLTIDAS